MGIESYTVSGLYTGKTLETLKADTLAKLKQKATNYDRYTAANITAALNDALVEAVRLTKCLQSFAIIQMKGGYSQYKPPTQYIEPLQAFFYQSATSYWELTQANRKWLDLYKPGWRTGDGDPRYMYHGDNYGNLRKLGFYPTPDTDGDDYTLSPDTGIYASEDSMDTSGNITGTNTTAHATTCTDSEGRDLATLGVTIGMTAVNVTDASQGQISAVTGATFTVTLAGGTADTWAVSDSFTILAGEYGVVVSWENDEQFLFASEIGGMVDVSTLVGNVYLEFVRRPLLLQFDTQYPEIPPDLHQYLPDYAVYSLKRNAPAGSQDQKEAMSAHEAFLWNIENGYTNLDDSADFGSCVRCNL